jgi:UDP-N-acetylmuramoylalanine--D-glutamate ligase
VAARLPLPPGPFLVVGLARSGVAVALALRALGEEVVGCDAGPVTAARRAELEAAGVAVHADSEGVELLAAAPTLVKSPGVPKEAPVVAAAHAQGLAVLGEVELGWRLVGNDLIAVTGSNGKTTTAELIGHVHREAGLAVSVVGNVGTALSSLAGSGLPESATVVCEVSSFQLEDTVLFAPDAAVLLNLAEDHLDRHGSFEAYRDAKLQVFARQGEDALAVVPQDLGVAPVPGRGAAWVELTVPAREAGWVGGRARRVRYGSEPGADLLERDGRLWWGEEPLMAVEEIRLRGPHNRKNSMAAAAVCLARGVDPAAVRAGLASFGGVAHRLEEVATLDGVLYVNDSKATNVASAAVGIASFTDGVHVILGGRGKGGDYGPLAAPVAERCRAVYLIGENAEEIRLALASTGVPLLDCEGLERAVAAARAAARPGEVVLLSPAAASFDQYADYEERGAHFRALVEGAG